MRCELEFDVYRDNRKIFINTSKGLLVYVIFFIASYIFFVRKLKKSQAKMKNRRFEPASFTLTSPVSHELWDLFVSDHYDSGKPGSKFT